MSDFQYCTTDEVVASVYAQLDIEDTRDKFIFREWIYDAMREIGPGYIDVGKVCLKVENLCFEKPCDLINILELNLISNDGTVLPYEYRGGNFLDSEIQDSFAGTTSATLLGNVNYGINHIVVAEQDRSYVLSSNGGSAVKAEMTYWRFPITKDGEIKIPENLKLPIVTYIEWMYWKRERSRKRTEIPMSEVQYYHDMWINRMIQAKGRRKMPNQEMAQTIKRNWVTMIANFKDRKKNSYRSYYNNNRF